MSCGLGSRSRPSVEFLSHEWLLTLGTPLVDPRKRQTSTATPAKPGGLPLTLAIVSSKVAPFDSVGRQDCNVGPGRRLKAGLGGLGGLAFCFPLDLCDWGLAPPLGVAAALFLR